jgi:hypothetical protein
LFKLEGCGVERYSLDYLDVVFSRHVRETLVQREAARERFVIDNPGEEMSEWVEDDFNLPLALLSLVKEIIKLRAEVERRGRKV